jgi:hypothetical protein
MGSLPNWLIVTALGVLLALAAGDAIRSTGDAQPPPEPAQTVASELRGLLFVAGSDCSVTALRLPERTTEEPPRRPDCRGAVWSHDGTLVAECQGGVTVVSNADGELFRRVRGCTAAWNPNGFVSVIRAGSLVLARSVFRPVPLLTRDDVARLLAGIVPRPATYELVAVAWIDSSTFAAIVRRGSQPADQYVVIFRDGRIETVVPVFGPPISALRASPRGKVAFARGEVVREFVMLERDGDPLPLPRVANARAIAWSPDEQWVALATRTNVFIARTGTREIVARVAVGGESLEWLP